MAGKSDKGKVERTFVHPDTDEEYVRVPATVFEDGDDLDSTVQDNGVTGEPEEEDVDG